MAIIRRLWGLLLIISLLLTALEARSASIDRDDRGYRIEGQIAAGDYNKLLRLIAQRGSIRLSLNSKGGDLNEAIKIAELVSRIGLWTYVGKGDICASACFFIWHAGEYRTAKKINRKDVKMNIGLHRPYLINPSTEHNSTEAQKRAQRKIVVYLEERLVPRRLIDTMMARASNDIYWITEDDYFEMGEYPPHLEELVIAKCRYDKHDENRWISLLDQSRYDEADELEAKMEAANKCAANIQIDRATQARENFFNPKK